MHKFLEKNSEYFYFVFRLFIGVLFFLHGIMKMPMILSGNLSLFSLIGLAGVIEIIAGILFVVGLFTRYTAIITSIEMAVAYFMAHFPNGFNPLYNNGEPAVLFFAAFLLLIAYGSGKISLDKLFFKKY